LVSTGEKGINTATRCRFGVHASTGQKRKWGKSCAKKITPCSSREGGFARSREACRRFKISDAGVVSTILVGQKIGMRKGEGGGGFARDNPFNCAKKSERKKGREGNVAAKSIALLKAKHTRGGLTQHKAASDLALTDSTGC